MAVRGTGAPSFQRRRSPGRHTSGWSMIRKSVRSFHSSLRGWAVVDEVVLGQQVAIAVNATQLTPSDPLERRVPHRGTMIPMGPNTRPDMKPIALAVQVVATTAAARSSCLIFCASHRPPSCPGCRTTPDDCPLHQKYFSQCRNSHRPDFLAVTLPPSP